MARSAPKKTLTALDALTQARALLADPAVWTRSAPARMPSGAAADPLDPKACRWCATGALGKVTGHWRVPGRPVPGFAELEAASIGLTGLGIGVLNDRRETDHQTILAVYDRAITGAKTALTT